MSNEHLGWAFNQRTKTSVEKLVLIYLADRTNPDTGESWYAQKTIAAKCQLARETVNRAINSLVDQGLLEIEHRVGKNGEAMTNITRFPSITPPVTETHTPCDPDALVKANQKSTPIVPLKKTRAKPELTYAEWSASLATGQRAMPANDPIFAYADRAGIPMEFMRLAWLEFRRKHLESGGKDKRQKDWRQTFRNYVEGNYLKLWFVDGGEYRLTTVGAQAQKLHGAG